MTSTLTEQIKAYAISLGADLVGVADLEQVKGIPTIPANLLTPYRYAVIIGIAYSYDVFEQIIDGPTPLYSKQQTSANGTLDQMSFFIQKKIAAAGYRALAQPASLVMDKENWMPNVSTKALARAAGLGWLGKNLLLITPEYGSRVRMAAILTDAPLEAGSPMTNHCGECARCQEACPAGAIRGAYWLDYPESRETALDFAKCLGKLKDEFSPRPDIGQPICGICIKACPFTQPKSVRATPLIET